MSIALKPRYSVSSDGITLTVKERTGQYSALNLGGWDPTGADNPIVSEATVAEIRIAKRTSSGSLGTESTVDVYDDLPSDSEGSVEILAADAGQGGSFSNGIYRITYVVQGVWTTNANTPFLATKATYVPLIPGICTCWQQTSAAFAKCTCNCGAISEKLNKISLYMKLLEEAYECQNVNAMQQFIDLLTKLCASNGCCN